MPPAAPSSRLSVMSCRSRRRTRGADRGPNRKLTLSARPAREQQARDVGAGNQQDHADGAEEHEQGLAHVADDLLVERLNRRRPGPTFALR